MSKSLILYVFFILSIFTFSCKSTGYSSNSSENSKQMDIAEILETAFDLGPYSFVFSQALQKDSTIVSPLPIFMSGARGLVIYSNFNSAVGQHLPDSLDVTADSFDLSPLSIFAGINLFDAGHEFKNRNYSTDPDQAFAHYNPEWILWASEHLIPDPTSTIKGISAQMWYDKSFKRFFHLLVESYSLLEKSELWELERIQYYEALKSSEFDALRYFDHRFQNQLTDYTYPYSHEVMTGPMAISFWLRREMDGSRDEFWTGLSKFMNQYDKQWFLEHIS